MDNTNKERPAYLMLPSPMQRVMRLREQLQAVSREMRATALISDDAVASCLAHCADGLDKLLLDHIDHGATLILRDGRLTE